MSRKPRKFTSSGCYHVMIKGVGNQIIFEDDSDRVKFLSLLKKYCKQLSVKIYAFCFMENHVHLLIKDKDNISLFMQKLEISYAYYFNLKYQRIGPLFNGRFVSEIIDNDEYFLTAFRYIIKNPEKAGICRYQDYKWSSIKEYLEENDSVFSVTDTFLIKSMFGSTDTLIEFMNNSNEKEVFVDIKEKNFIGIDEEKARTFIKNRFKIESTVLIRSFERKKREKAIKIMKNAGFSIRQIERLSGISRGVIQKI